MKKNVWEYYIIPYKSIILEKIGTKENPKKPGGYYIMHDTYQKAIRIKNDEGKEYQKINIQLVGDVSFLLKNLTNHLADYSGEIMWREFSGEFTKTGIDKIPDDLKGLYFIHNPDSETMYLGKSNAVKGVKSRLKSHLTKSTNQALKYSVQSGEKLLFFCWESPDPKYEEAIEIRRLKGAGFLVKQRRENKPLIYLDLD